MKVTITGTYTGRGQWGVCKDRKSPGRSKVDVLSHPLVWVKLGSLYVIKKVSHSTGQNVSQWRSATGGHEQVTGLAWLLNPSSIDSNTCAHLQTHVHSDLRALARP